MEWSKIKTLFILCFLVLDVYLLFQFMNKQKEADLRVQSRSDASIEEQLAMENIKVAKLPDKEYTESYMTIRQRTFNNEDREKLGSLNGQQSRIIEDKLIFSSFNKPIPLPQNGEAKDIESLVKKHVIHPGEYKLWTWDKKLNVLLLFQKKNDRPVYFNQNGMILVYLNEKNEMIGYAQTMLGKQEKTKSEEKTLIKPMKAVEILYKSNQLRSGDEIKKADLVFYTRVPLRNGVQVFVPTWKIVVKHEKETKSFFVNAIEEFVIPSDETLFLKSVTEENIKKLQKTEMVSGLKDQMIIRQEQLLDKINQEENEE